MLPNKMPILSTAAVRAKLRRELVGSADPAEPSGEHLLLHLVNAGDFERARELLKESATIGPDLAACVRAVIGREGADGRRDKPYTVPWPPEVWDFYAQMAREEHLSIRAALIDAVRRDRDRILRARQDVEEPHRTVLDELREIRRMLDTPRNATAPQPVACDLAGRLEALAKASDELTHHARIQGTALTAVLMTLDAKGWIPKRLAEQLRKQKWL